VACGLWGEVVGGRGEAREEDRVCLRLEWNEKSLGFTPSTGFYTIKATSNISHDMIFVRAHRLPTATWGCRLNRVWSLTALSILSAGTREANWRWSCIVWDVHVRRLASQSQLGSNPFWSRHVCLSCVVWQWRPKRARKRPIRLHTHTVVCAATAAVSKKSWRQRKRARSRGRRFIFPTRKESSARYGGPDPSFSCRHSHMGRRAHRSTYGVSAPCQHRLVSRHILS
jgi:hypothetical protein